MATLDGERIDALKQQLIRRRGQLAEELHQRMKSTQDKDYAALVGQVRDAGDESVVELLGSLSAITTEMEMEELQNIEAALQRMARGVYGRCTECGSVVPAERLQANPAADRCITCQQKLEGPVGGRDRTPSL
ncbi:MAG: TraR/DksA family transcriptional regulator [Gammaproteobacteria bacterium]|nr:TraR/DksA family transcriptional regulator [Gammaproteobacteria bacterium]